MDRRTWLDCAAGCGVVRWMMDVVFDGGGGLWRCMGKRAERIKDGAKA
jgi:hypothetical protein